MRTLQQILLAAAAVLTVLPAQAANAQGLRAAPASRAELEVGTEVSLSELRGGVLVPEFNEAWAQGFPPFDNKATSALPYGASTGGSAIPLALPGPSSRPPPYEVVNEPAETRRPYFFQNNTTEVITCTLAINGVNARVYQLRPSDDLRLSLTSQQTPALTCPLVQGGVRLGSFSPGARYIFLRINGALQLREVVA